MDLVRFLQVIQKNIVYFVSDKAQERALEPSQKPELSLSTLPSELIVHINIFLPNHNAGALVTCSKRFWLLGYSAMRPLRCEGQASRLRFLMLLQNDLQHWLLCYYCQCFHPLKKDDGPHRAWRHFREPACVRASGIIYINVNYKLRFHHAQSVMLEYRRSGNPDNGEVKQLSRNLDKTYRGENVKTEIKVSILNSELAMRVSAVIHLSDITRFNCLRYRMPQICVHLNRLYAGPFHLQEVLCHDCHSTGKICGDCGGLRCCKQCGTLFELEAKEIGTEGSRREIRITIWKFLGPCTSPFEPKWSSQVETSGTSSGRESGGFQYPSKTMGTYSL